MGQALVKELLSNHSPGKVIVYSRDECKQIEMSRSIKDKNNLIRYFLGDIRDKERLYRAFHGVDIVIHAAALKHIDKCEYDPSEAIKTNILGAQNIVEAAIDQRVKQVLAISTDKAVNPICLYGAAKLCADKLFVAANSYSGQYGTKFAVVRFGNFIGSRGSVIPYWEKLRDEGKSVLPITSLEMTRYWIEIEEAARFTLESLRNMHGGEIFVPKMKATKLIDIAMEIHPKAQLVEVGLRPGEKLHEDLINRYDATKTWETDKCYITYPSSNVKGHGTRVKKGFEYTSQENTAWTIKKSS